MSTEGYTPPPPPDEQGDYREEGYSPESQSQEQSAINGTGPRVASAGTKNLMLIVIGLLLGGFLLYQIFFASDEAEELPEPLEAPPPTQGQNVAPPSEIPIPSNPVLPPPLPPPPPIEEPEEPQPLPPPPPVTPNIDFSSDAPANQEQQRRRTSEMLIANAPDKTKTEPVSDNTSKAERAVATNVGDLNRLVLQGKIIDAVLETAIDTTLPGPLRAVTTRDVYAESNYEILIPKGSRIIGVYNTDIVQGQARVFIVWNRLIRPDGVDVQIDSQTVDSLGRSGIKGFVDERYFEIFSGAVLTSVLGIALAGVADAILDPEATTKTTNTDGSTTSNGSGLDQAITEGVTSIGSASKRIVGGLLDMRPNITLDQGTPLKVFVNRDLEFPESVINKTKVIQ